MAPLVVKGKVLVGNSGGEFGVRGWLTALDAATRQDRLAGLQHRARQGRADRPDFKPFYASDRGKDLGVTTWPPDAWKIGGGTVWGWISYDPELNLDLLRHRATPARGTPSSGPATTSGPPASSRATPDTGEARWFYQIEPARPATTTTASTRTCCSTCRSDGQTRKVLRASRPQRLHLRASTARPARCSRPTPFVPHHLDQGRRPEDRAADPRSRRRSRELGKVDPRHLPGRARRQGLAAVGVLAAHRAALHPAPTTCAWTSRASRRTTSPARRTSARTCRCTPGPGGNRGEFTAWDPVAGEAVWSDQGELPGLERRAW